MLVYPNQRKMSLVPSSLALFARLLKQLGVAVELFDTSLFKHQYFDDPDEIAEKYLCVKPAVNKFKNKIALSVEDPIENFRLKVNDFKPDLIAVTCVESTFNYAVRLLRSIREHKILTVMGGVFPTFSPEFALSHAEVDIICRGDGEKAIVELVKRLRNGKDYTDINNLYVKKGSYYHWVRGGCCGRWRNHWVYPI